MEDCLTVLLNLLINNASNQSYFRESSFIRRLVHFFELNSIGDKRWLTQKINNVHLLLQVRIQTIDSKYDFNIQVIRTLVSPTNANQNILTCQRTIHQCGK